MSQSSNITPELLEICTAWSKGMEKLTAGQPRIEFIREHLPELLRNESLFEELVNRIAKGKSYPDIRHTDMFDNEILLYLNAKRMFSLRMILFGPQEFTPIHDHNAWGVTGTVLNELTVVTYHRDDDGSVEGFAKIHETGQLKLTPGDTELTMPLNEGIHKTGTTRKEPVLMVSVYGNPIRRRFINRYDVEKNRVLKMFAPRVKKKLLAKALLDAFASGH